MSGSDHGIGFNDHPNGTNILVVTGQHDRIFAGRIEIMEGDAGIFTEDVAMRSVVTAGHSPLSKRVVTDPARYPETRSSLCT